MKIFLNIKILFALVIMSLFSITAKSQCTPNAGANDTICSMCYDLEAIPEDTSSTAQWTVYTKPVGSNVTYGSGSADDAQLFETSVCVSEYGTYEFIIEETNVGCTGYDTILIIFAAPPTIYAGDDQYICGWRTQLEGTVSGYYDYLSWMNAPIYWTDSAFWHDTPNNELPVLQDPEQQRKLNAYITSPIQNTDCIDSVYMVLITGLDNCYSMDTVKLFFAADINAADSLINIEEEVTGLEVALNTNQDIYCANGYWIDSLGIVTNWNPSYNNPNTIATVYDYGDNAFAYVIENGNIFGLNYPVCSDTSSFHVVTFLTTAINSLEGEEINAYPNPTTGIITIKTKKIKQVKIFSLTGKTIKQLVINKEKLTIDLSKEAKGIYFVELIGEEFISTQKIILE